MYRITVSYNEKPTLIIKIDGDCVIKDFLNDKNDFSIEHLYFDEVNTKREFIAFVNQRNRLGVTDLDEIAPDFNFRNLKDNLIMKIDKE